MFQGVINHACRSRVGSVAAATLSRCSQHGPQSQDFVMGHCPEPEQQEAVGLSISDMDTALQRAKGSQGREAIRGPHMGTRS